MPDQGKTNLDFLPSWVVDPKVKSFLGSEGIEIVILNDDKFRRGKSSKPLIVLRGSNLLNQSYLYAQER